jgi:hypothetical protein
MSQENSKGVFCAVRAEMLQAGQVSEESVGGVSEEITAGVQS